MREREREVGGFLVGMAPTPSDPLPESNLRDKQMNLLVMTVVRVGTTCPSGELLAELLGDLLQVEAEGLQARHGGDVLPLIPLDALYRDDAIGHLVGLFLLGLLGLGGFLLGVFGSPLLGFDG